MQPAKTQNLGCYLNDEEIAEKGKSLARTQEQRNQNSLAKKAAMSGFKETDDDLAAEIQKLVNQINNRREYRQVEVEERPDYETNLMEIYRRDTGERISTRPLTTDELQLKFGFPRPTDEPGTNERDIEESDFERVERENRELDELQRARDLRLQDKAEHETEDLELSTNENLINGVSEIVRPRRTVSGWTPEEIAAKDLRIAEKLERQS